MTSHILVTGGAGFIGSNLVARLLADGFSVTVLDDLSSGHRVNLPDHENLRFIHGDMRDRETADEATRGAELVFHLAASVGNQRSIDNPIDDASRNVIGTLQVLEAARRHGVRKVVASSSAGIFGELKTMPIHESHPVEPDTPYGSSKLAAEKECLAYAKLFSLEVVCLRYFNVYGPNQRFDAYGNVIPIFVFKMLRGESLSVFGDGEQTRDFLNVRDVVEANWVAAQTKGLSGAFNLGSGTRVSINALVASLEHVMELPANVKHTGARRGDVRHSLADIAAARLAFGFNPNVTLLDGLTEYVSWARAEHERTQRSS